MLDDQDEDGKTIKATVASTSDAQDSPMPLKYDSPNDVDTDLDGLDVDDKAIDKDYAPSECSKLLQNGILINPFFIFTCIALLNTIGIHSSLYLCCVHFIKTRS